MLIALPPIAFHSKNYCRQHELIYKTENEMVVDYINNLRLEDYIGKHDPKDVVVLADSGYDDKNIENAISGRKWRFIIALKKTRSVNSERAYCTTARSKGWSNIDELFKNQRRVEWQPIRSVLDSARRKRMGFRIRQIVGYLAGKIRIV